MAATNTKKDKPLYRKGDIAPRDEWAGILAEAFDRAARAREKSGGNAAGVALLKKSFLGLPAYLDARELREFDGFDTYELDVLDVHALKDQLVVACEELHHLRGKPVRITFARDVPKRMGMIIRGKARAVPAKERDLWTGEGPAPWYEVCLTLPVWAVDDAPGRMRLLHHELMHCGIGMDAQGRERPCTNPHDIEENEATVARFGIANAEHAKVFAQALRHPTTPARLKEWAIDPKTGQGLLWGPWTQSMATIGLAEAEQ